MLLKKKMRSGQKLCGTMLRIVRNPAICYLAKNAGLDFVMPDCEHGNYDFETLHDMFITANALGITCFVRVPQGSKDYISRALDTGAGGVMVPLVETVEQARTLVKYAKYPPVGDRGFNAVGPHTNYLGGKHADVMEQGNAKVIAIAQIETATAIDNIDAIAAVEGLDALLIGPNDLSVSLGIPGELTHPKELEAIAAVAAACKKHSKAFGLHSAAPLLEKFAKDLGIVMSLSDTDFLVKGLAGVRNTCDSLGSA